MDNGFPKAYAAWTKDTTLRFNSTSGGIFSELAYAVLAQGGYVCGAKYNENNKIEHYITGNKKDVESLRQSKYAQSAMNDIYQRVRTLLIDQKLVAFVGTPCQVAGLKSYLGKKYDNLLTFDFICRGVNSPKAYRCWLSEIEKKEASTVTNVWFKYKAGGWKTSPTRTKICFKDGHEKIYAQVDNLFMIGYLGPNLYIRKSCGDCRFKGAERCSDITLADFWGITDELDDDCGTSLVLVNTPKGEKIWGSIHDKLEVYKQDSAYVFAQNPMFNQSVNINPKSTLFLKRVTDNNFSQLVKHYIKVPLYQKIYLKIKRCVPAQLKNLANKYYSTTMYGQTKARSHKERNDEQNVSSSIPILYNNKKDCCGCTACFAICPKQAITMLKDEEGFEYPYIDVNKCINCQQCIRACPIKTVDSKSK